ncbi:MAG: hypothetical protein LBV33_07725 [Lachnospiraceae bacterium]|jgi:hypothetical protein|nr:hypothetical protein [Lachnospiraceae bacterium]
MNEMYTSRVTGGIAMPAFARFYYLTGSSLTDGDNGFIINNTGIYLTYYHMVISTPTTGLSITTQLNDSNGILIPRTNITNEILSAEQHVFAINTVLSLEAGDEVSFVLTSTGTANISRHNGVIMFLQIG